MDVWGHDVKSWRSRVTSCMSGNPKLIYNQCRNSWYFEYLYWTNGTFSMRRWLVVMLLRRWKKHKSKHKWNQSHTYHTIHVSPIQQLWQSINKPWSKPQMIQNHKLCEYYAFDVPCVCYDSHDCSLSLWLRLRWLYCSSNQSPAADRRSKVRSQSRARWADLQSLHRPRRAWSTANIFYNWHQIFFGHRH